MKTYVLNLNPEYHTARTVPTQKVEEKIVRERKEKKKEKERDQKARKRRAKQRKGSGNEIE